EVTNDMVQNILSQCNGTLPNSGISSGSSIFRQENINAHNYLCEDYVKWGWQFLIYLGGSEFYGFYDIIFDQGFHCRSGQNNHPCTDITWYGAIMMCNWITGNSSNTGRQVYSGIETDDEWWDDETICNFNRTGFRLPTTAEWECAARWQGNDNSGDCYEYPTGSGQYWTRGGCASGASAPTSNVNATAAVAVYEYDSDGYTNPDDTDKIKGNRQPNKLGLYDMSGNVWEWCFDDAGRFIRVIRGGGAQSKHHDVRISSTSYYPADGTASDLGFRLVMSAGN
ncbi:MAG: SUMF1/EgtB/PvdO family nonheme iron enzyme, partial [Bacteroidales bacterium]|nr:SUMF1/EgtB/PvdO family nonheme iron enzyme [Bacteroidales bacterium]